MFFCSRQVGTKKTPVILQRVRQGALLSGANAIDAEMSATQTSKISGSILSLKKEILEKVDTFGVTWAGSRPTVLGRKEMAPIRSIWFAIVLAISAGSATISLAGSPEEDVKSAYAAFDAAFGKADAKAIAAFYVDDAILLPASHEVIKGPAGVEKFFSGIFAGGATGHRLEVIEARGSGTLLFGAAKWSAKGKDASGKDEPWGGLATHIFERQNDGSLKIKLHTFN
jgi:ketosteroid isomerase-like protein